MEHVRIERNVAPQALAFAPTTVRNSIRIGLVCAALWMARHACRVSRPRVVSRAQKYLVLAAVRQPVHDERCRQFDSQWRRVQFLPDQALPCPNLHSSPKSERRCYEPIHTLAFTSWRARRLA